MFQKRTKATNAKPITRKLTDVIVGELKPAEGRSRVANDTRQHGLYLNISGGKRKVTKTWRVRYRHGGTTSSFRLGHFPAMGVDAARTAAHAFLENPQTFLNPNIPVADDDTTDAIAKNFMKRWVESRNLKSRDEIQRMLDKYVLPVWGERRFKDITRRDVSKLLDSIEDSVAARAKRGNEKPWKGTRQADMVLAIIRKMANWYMTTDQDYVSPIVRGMNRSENTPRDRVLSKEEIRAIWTEAEARDSGVYGGLVRMLLLTGQRKEKVSTMRYSDVVDGVWTIPKNSYSKEKGHIGKVKLPQMALDIIKEQVQIAGNPYIFAKSGKVAFNSWSLSKAKFEKRLRKNHPDMDHWTVHDLRRTSRTLMSEAKINDDLAERVIGHKVVGVQRVYNLYDYEAEKTAALETLARLLAKITASKRTKIIAGKRIRRFRPVTGLPATH